MTPVLELHEIWAGYGPFQALFDVNIAIEPGQAVALLGVNGAGKTTVARVASGLIAPERGAVLIDGKDLTGAPPSTFARSGIAHAVEGRSVFASLSVEDNLRLSFRRKFGARGVGAALESAYDKFPILAERRTQLAGQLSGGEQRMLSMARVMVEEPVLLIADELSLGLAPIIVDSIYEQLRRLRDAGTALLIVEQHVTHALELADRVLLLDHGSIVWEGDPADAGDLVSTRIFDHETG